MAPQAEPAINLGAGNPVHVVTGNKYQQETDMPASAISPGLEIVRHYNAQDTRSSPLGRGWRLSYDTQLFKMGGRWQIVQANGSRIEFASANGSPRTNAHGDLRPHGTMWVWTWRTGRQLWFNSAGWLIRIVAGTRLPGATNNAAMAAGARAGDYSRVDLHIKRHTEPGPLAGTISAIVDAQGHTLTFAYRIIAAQAYLDSIATPLGRYAYGMDTHRRLAAMVRPDGVQRRYFYESAWQSGNTYAMTGIETLAAGDTRAKRTNSWAYDAQGRATLAIRGPHTDTTHRLELRYVREPTREHDGLTIATDENGHTTQFQTALRGARHVVTAVHGAACEGCAAPGSNATYDAEGRFTQINGTHVQRHPDGSIRRLQPLASGWPRLSLDYGPDGLRVSWSSMATGTERMVYNGARQPVQRRWANGDAATYDYDAQGRPRHVSETSGHARMETTLAWRGASLAQLRHPHESETRDYDERGRLKLRRVWRLSAHSSTQIHYREAFAYDTMHRLVRHQLPEGGSLTYRWGPDHRLAGIRWQDANGIEHTVIDSKPGVPGYRHGNGLHTMTMLNTRGQAALLGVAGRERVLWTQALSYDDRGRLAGEQHRYASPRRTEAWTYAYDPASRMVGAQVAVTQASTTVSAVTWYAWNGDGSLAAARHRGASRKPVIVRDASGLASEADGNVLTYGPNRRLVRVQPPTGPTVEYFHNAYGHRMARRASGANVDYFHLGNQLVAESTRPQHQPGHEAYADTKPNAAGKPHTNSNAAMAGPHTPLAVTRRYIHAGPVPVAFIDYGQASGLGQLFAVHADLVGAPRMVTDATQTVRWLAAYDATGAAQPLAGDLDFDLRLPGQVFDATTGWHDNIFRTYAPALGHYLEPDPLGPLPASQAYGYANQQPRRHADPLGLLLFSFDGTRNDPTTRSNVWKMSQTYRDGPVFYHSGPGTPLYVNWDAITGWQASRIIDTQWQSLLNALDRDGSTTQSLPIDILGYSRGAALARHFGNLINQHVDRGLFTYTDALRGLISACVDLRFMGLFDTVAQFGVAGSHNANYDLTVAAAWEWVAHAVALHERRWLFPLSGVADTNGSNVIEAPFIGAHVDIGGGMLPGDDGPAPSGDLADVTLNWMLWQARAAATPFNAAAPSDRVVTDPILHDQRAALLRSVQDGDRSVQTSTGSVLHQYQDDHARLGQSQRNATESLIARSNDWRGNAGNDVGRIDMSGYAQWLHDELGWSASLH